MSTPVATNTSSSKGSATRYIYPSIAPDGPLSSDKEIRGGRQWQSKALDYLKLTIYDPSIQSPYTWVGGKEAGDYGKFKGSASDEQGIYSSIYLHMPHQLNENYSVKYNRATLGPFGGALEQAVAGANAKDGTSNVATQLNAGAGTGASQAVFGAISGLFNDASQQLNVDGNLSRDQIVGLTKQRVFNPYEETVFEGTNYRSHNFDFDLVPRNSKEVTEIYQIINTLRDSMLPGMDGTKNQWLTIPRFFKAALVRFEPAQGQVNSGDNEGRGLGRPATLSRILQFPVKMVLVNMDVNLTPMGSHTSLRDMTAMKRYQDLGPAAYKLTLSFDETALITRNMLEGGTGYKSDWDGVGEKAEGMDQFNFLEEKKEDGKEGTEADK